MRITAGGLAAALIVATIAAVCVRLGIWQLDRLQERRGRNAAYAAALELPPVELGGIAFEEIMARPAGFVYRRVRVEGEPDPGSEVVWRGRSLDGRPGVNMLTPYRVAGGAIVLVNRGWLPSPDAAHVEPARFRPPIDAAPAGILVPLPSAPERARPSILETEGASILSVQQPDPAVLSDRLGAPVLTLYVQQTGPSGGDLPMRLPAPDLADEGPHMGYAIQWFSFAAIAVLGFAIVLLIRSRSVSP